MKKNRILSGSVGEKNSVEQPKLAKSPRTTYQNTKQQFKLQQGWAATEAVINPGNTYNNKN